MVLLFFPGQERGLFLSRCDYFFFSFFYFESFYIHVIPIFVMMIPDRETIVGELSNFNQ